jgi:hypothetical protein
VSLWRHRRAIARAVAGDLPRADEARLRAHLETCARCRGHYDALAGVAAALDGGRAAAALERARLFAALDAPTAPRAAPPARRPWLVPALALAPVVALVVAWRLHAPTVTDGADVTLRGAPGADRAAPASLLLHASRKTGAGTHGPVRLVADLPGSGEGRVSTADYVQLGVRGLRAPAYVSVVGVDARGVVHTYVPRAGTAPRLEPSGGVQALGPSFELGRELPPGRVRVAAFFSPAALDEAAVRAAAVRLDAAAPDAVAKELHAEIVSGVIVVEP